MYCLSAYVSIPLSFSDCNFLISSVYLPTPTSISSYLLIVSTLSASVDALSNSDCNCFHTSLENISALDCSSCGVASTSPLVSTPCLSSLLLVLSAPALYSLYLIASPKLKFLFFSSSGNIFIASKAPSSVAASSAFLLYSAIILSAFFNTVSCSLFNFVFSVSYFDASCIVFLSLSASSLICKVPISLSAAFNSSFFLSSSASCLNASLSVSLFILSTYIPVNSLFASAIALSISAKASVASPRLPINLSLSPLANAPNLPNPMLAMSNCSDSFAYSIALPLFVSAPASLCACILPGASVIALSIPAFSLFISSLTGCISAPLLNISCSSFSPNANVPLNFSTVLCTISFISTPLTPSTIVSFISSAIISALPASISF